MSKRFASREGSAAVRTHSAETRPLVIIGFGQNGRLKQAAGGLRPKFDFGMRTHLLIKVPRGAASRFYRAVKIVNFSTSETSRKFPMPYLLKFGLLFARHSILRCSLQVIHCTLRDEVQSQRLYFVA